MAVVAALIGLVLASFIGSLAYRSARSISIVSPPSFCPGCGRRLRPWELIPVASWLLLRGRCSSCGAKIPVVYFVVEAALPAVFVLLYCIYGLSPGFFAWCYLVTVLFYLSLVDLDQGSIALPDAAAVYAGGVAVVVLKAHTPWPGDPLSSLYAFGATGALLGLAWLVVLVFKGKKGLGAGDLLVLPGVALFMGLRQAVMVLIASSLIGILTAVVLMAVGAVDRTTRLPLLPFVAGGVCIEILLITPYISL
jgi:leader peptidase (prepilin peptidase)/N-methyltransferase